METLAKARPTVYKTIICGVLFLLGKADSVVGVLHQQRRNNPLSGNNYYRIKAIENNGVIKFSKIVLVKNDEIQLNISPNPVSNYFVIECQQMKQINILDMQGKIVLAIPANNVNIKKINTSQFVKGFYLVQVITSRGEIKTRKIVVE